MNIDPERCIGCGNHRTVCICSEVPHDPIGWKDAPDSPGTWIHKYRDTIQGWFSLLSDGEQLVLISHDGKIVPFAQSGNLSRYFGPIPKDSKEIED